MSSPFCTYEGENNAVEERLKTNGEGYSERLKNGNANYRVEYYDERFDEKEANPIAEIWVPVEKA